MTILRTVDELAEASGPDLVETYNALTGKSITKFENLTIGRRKVEMAMLTSKGVDGQTGVPANTEPQVKTREELEQKLIDKGKDPADLPSTDPEEERPSFALGTMAATLQQQADKATPPPERVKPKKGETTKAAPIVAVRATFAGTSKPQPGSQRNAVLLRVQQSPDSCALVADLDAHFAMPTRGYLQKLIDVKHIELCSAEEAAKAKAENLPARQAPVQASGTTQEPAGAAPQGDGAPEGANAS